jgi:hypothetical protein
LKLPSNPVSTAPDKLPPSDAVTDTFDGIACDPMFKWTAYYGASVREPSKRWG